MRQLKTTRSIYCTIRGVIVVNMLAHPAYKTLRVFMANDVLDGIFYQSLHLERKIWKIWKIGICHCLFFYCEAVAYSVGVIVYLSESELGGGHAVMDY